jgi:chromosome partition protein MukB
VRDWLRRGCLRRLRKWTTPVKPSCDCATSSPASRSASHGQESDLRGASEDVARGIDVQIRKARGQVNRLNKNLEGVSFGSIQGDPRPLQPVEKMEQVLRALRDGAAQELLFQADMPDRGRARRDLPALRRRSDGGQRLLDYREYVHLQVEIRRKAGADWESPTPRGCRPARRSASAPR